MATGRSVFPTSKVIEAAGTNISGGAALPNPGPTWHVAGAADFNGDGKSDILWQHDSGSPAIWIMDGTNISRGAALPNPGPTWHIAEAADFNGDGKSDILWQHDSGLPAIWTMDGTNITRRRRPSQSWARLAHNLGRFRFGEIWRCGNTVRPRAVAAIGWILWTVSH